MADLVEAVAVARALQDLPVVSRDPITVQAANFARAASRYEQAVRASGVGSPAAQEAHDTYRLSAALYAPTLIAFLAAAVGEMSETING